MIGKNEPKNTSHPKIPVAETGAEPAEPNGAHQDPLGGVQTPSVGDDRKKKFGKAPDEGPQDPIWRISMAAETQTRPAQKRHGSNGELCSRLRLVLDTLRCFRGWRLA